MHRYLTSAFVALPFALSASAASADGYCPRQVTQAFPECVAIVITDKDGNDQVCGCRENRVSQVEIVEQRIPKALQDRMGTRVVLLEKIKMKGDPDPCQTIIVNGVAVNYCW